MASLAPYLLAQGNDARIPASMARVSRCAASNSVAKSELTQRSRARLTRERHVPDRNFRAHARSTLPMDSSPEAASQIRVFILSAVRLHREGLAALLRGCPSIDVRGAHNIHETQDALRTTAIDVALIDAQWPSDDTVSVLRKMCARVRILAIGIRETTSEVLACAAAGIDGYVPRDAALGDMVAAIENVVRGELACSPKVAASLYQCVGLSRAAGTTPLTARELQIAELMNRGCPTKEIAWRLGVQPCTAKNHIRNILHKLHVHGRGQAVAKLRMLFGERFGSA
jgi:two-component system nitrate/nitrite response regulator NarL